MSGFRKGQVVQISGAHHWAQGAFGIVAEPPEAVANLAGDWQGCVRFVKTLHGTVPFYWIEFDEPQNDSDGDGPYAGGEIDGSYLSAVDAV